LYFTCHSVHISRSHLFFYQGHTDLRVLHSFPTRRSSDLLGGFLTGLAASTPVILADRKLAHGSTPQLRKQATRRTWFGLILVALVLLALTLIGALLLDTATILNGSV